jgi:hypothetical protein
VTCEHTRRIAAELALGIADGADRAQTIEHIADCAECRRELEELSSVADELLTLAPAHEPPPGFESRVLTRLRPARRRYWRPLRALAPAAAAAALAAGIVVGATRDDVRLADHYRATLAEAHGSYFEAARLRAPGGVPVGIAYAYRGAPSWIFVYVDAAHRRSYDAELAMASGARVPLPSLRIDPKTGSAGATLTLDVHDVAAIRLLGREPGDVLEAHLPHTGA